MEKDQSSLENSIWSHISECESLILFNYPLNSPKLHRTLCFYSILGRENPHSQPDMNVCPILPW